MSLMRLLSAGKSLIGVQEHTSRYRMGNPGMLPKFGSSKNPFRAAASKTEPQKELTTPATKSGSAIREKAAVLDVASGEQRASERIEKVSAALGASQVPKPAVSRVSKPAGKPGDLPTWQSAIRQVWKPALVQRIGLKLRGWLSRKRPELVTAARSALRAAVQGELSLDNVRVVRNDLSDTDLEVVPAGPRKTAAENGQEQKIETAAKAAATGRAEEARACSLSGRLDGSRVEGTAKAGLASARNGSSAVEPAGADAGEFAGKR